MVTADGPYYSRLSDIDFEQARRNPRPAPLAAVPCRPQPGRQGATGVTLLFISGTGGPRPAVGMALSSTLTAALPAFTKALAPVRVNLIAATVVR